MGHIRLGQLPRTRKWRDVVELVAVGADVSQVANATIRAADSAFSFVNNDSGYNQAVWLMTQLGLAAGEKDPLKYLRSQGIDIPDNTSLPGVAAAITQALDNHSDSNGGHSALGELSQRALVDAVIQCMEPKLRQQYLFNMQADDTERALADFRKPREFGQRSDFQWKARVKNEWGQIGEESVTEKTLDAEKKQIIKDFLVPLPNYGTVIQRSMRSDFDKRIHRFKAKVRGFTIAVNKQLETELTRNRRNLATELAQRLKDKPPPVLRKTLPSKPSLDVLVDVIDEHLGQTFGEVKHVFAPKVELRFKEVSYETLSDPGFMAALKKAFKRTFTQLFSEYDAAPSSVRHSSATRNGGTDQ